MHAPARFESAHAFGKAENMRANYENPSAARWHASTLDNPENFPFAFTCGGERFEGFPAERFETVRLEKRAEEEKEIAERVLRMGVLQITLRTAFYPGYGASEWTVWMENVGDADSGVIGDMETILTFEGAHPVLRGILGDHENLYRPYAVELEQMPACFYTDSGRATHVHFPYFNLEYGDGGAMLAIGWAGTWKATFDFDGARTTYRARAVNNLHTFLKPGERIRSALFVRAPYGVRSEDFATNYWRRWFVECNLPRWDASGRAMEPFSTCCLASDTGRPNSDGSISECASTWRPSLEKMIAEDVKVDFRWFDAGWYVAPDGSSPETDWWGTIGTWALDPAKWPGDSFRQSTDFARAHGMRTLMWFEPERVTDPGALAEHYGYDRRWAIEREGWANVPNNIGDPECLKWTTERVCRVLRENRVEMYREDNNSDPAALWQYLDEREGEDRRGITECKFVMGHYQMWDDIIACTLGHGGCGFVDSCASGGGRNDLESMRRGVPLLRSDNDRTSAALRLSMTTAFNRWIPFCGANTKEKLGQLDPRGESDPYVWRASYLPALNVDSQFVQDPEQDFDMLRFGLREWKKLRPYLLKDFYVHTPWHTEQDRSGFTAYSFFDPKAEKGALLLFRMEECGLDALRVRLNYAETGARYRLTDEDSGDARECSGEELRAGETFALLQKRSARLIWVERI